jgi:hypothetical protein
MTHILNRSPDWVTVLSILPTLDSSNSLPLLTLKVNHWGDEWELSISSQKLGTVHRVPSWVCDETFEGNPSHVFECHPYGHCVTKAEAIGRLFTGWLVATEIANPDVWKAAPIETGLPEYM